MELDIGWAISVSMASVIVTMPYAICLHTNPNQNLLHSKITLAAL